MPSQRILLAHTKTNQSGFAMVSALVLIPLLFTLLACGIGLSHSLEIKTRTESLCYKLSLSAQGQMKKNLMLLTSLNSKARKLRKQKKQAKLKMLKALATGQKALAAYYQIEINRIHALQVLLTKKQQSIFQESKRILNRYASQIHTSLDVRSLKIPPKGLAVKPKPETLLAPEYIPVSQFRNQQAVRITGSIAPLAQVQMLLASLKVPQLPNIEIQCGASLIKKGRTWKPVLETGKSLLKAS